MYHCIKETDKGEETIKTVSEEEAREWLDKQVDYIPDMESPDAYWFGIQSVEDRIEYQQKGYISAIPMKIIKKLKSFFNFKNKKSD